MPSHSVYALAENFPRELKYADAICRLEVVRGQFEGQWILRARKIVAPTDCNITSTRFGRNALMTILRNGFVIEDGTPASKVLDRLVHDGFAQRRPATRRDLH
jgi:hypothetical protein